jgi:hypothetical protein
MDLPGFLSSQRISILLCACLLLGAATPAAADSTVIGEPNITVSTPEPVVEATSTQSVQVVLINDGNLQKGKRASFEQEVQRAKNVQVEIQDNSIDAPIEIKSGKQTIGSISDGQRVPVDFRVEVGDADPGTYEIPVVIEYSHTRVVSFSQLDDTDRQTRSQEVIRDVVIEVEDKPQFAVTRVGGDSIVAGDNSEVQYLIENTGTNTATDTEATFTTTTEGTFFGKASSPSQTTARSLGSLEPGEDTTISVQMGAAENADNGTYPVPVTVEYENNIGIIETADPARANFTVQSARSFKISDVQLTNFRVDEQEAKMQAEITNEGPAPAQNVVVRVDAQNQLPLTVISGEAAVGDLAVGESAEVSFTVNIPEEAEHGSISVPLALEYENSAGDVLQPTTPLRQRVTIDEERDRFRVVGTNATVTPGGTGELTTTIEYTGNNTVTNANIKLFTNDPLSSSDDGAYLGTVAPGETVTATFRVSASDTALTKEYTSAVEVRYDEPDGDTRFTGSLTIGVPVSAADSGGLPLIPAFAISAIILVSGAVVVYRRQG